MRESTDAQDRATSPRTRAHGKPVEVRIATVLSSLVLLLTACSNDDDAFPLDIIPPHDHSVSDSEAFTAAAVALADDRARMADGWEVTSVGRVGPEPFGSVYIRVVYRGEVAKSPPDVCAIDHSGNVTGLVYLVSDPPRAVEAVSPEWDESVSCLGDTARQ